MKAKLIKVGEQTWVKKIIHTDDVTGVKTEREVETTSPLYVNPDNVIWIEGNSDLGCDIFFNTDRGSCGTAYITIGDVVVDDMIAILKGKTTYEKVKLSTFNKRYQRLEKLNRFRIVSETPID